MPAFRKKPVVITAEQFDGTPTKTKMIRDWVGDSCIFDSEDQFVIQTLEGTMTAEKGDWIIKGVKGEFYPCKPDIFDASYEPA